MKQFRIAPTSMTCATCARLAPGERCPDRCARNFVLSGWSSSLKHSRDAGMITSEDWIAVMHAQITKIVARPECRVLLARGADEPDVFGGFIAGEPSERVVYYCFVKGHYRRGGLARALFAALEIDPAGRFAYPCTTSILDDPRTLLRNKIPLARRDPSVARYPKQQRDRSYA